DGVQAVAGLKRGLVGLLRAVAGIDGVLVGLRGLGVSIADALLRAGVNVLDLASVRRSQVIQLVHTVADRAELALHVLLAGERIDFAPEALARVRLQRLLRREVLVRVSVGRGGGRSALAGGRRLLVRGILLRRRGDDQGCGQRQRK